jgi:hypothetical protein
MLKEDFFKQSKLLLNNPARQEYRYTSVYMPMDAATRISSANKLTEAENHN